ncbi:MAG: efflux RND transporter periplasmic adaptor subunit [Pseudomonadota bacterium]
MHRSRLLPVTIIGLGLVLAVVIITGKPKPEPSPVAKPPPPQVQVLTADPKTVTLTAISQGTVQPRREINVVAQVGGIVVSVSPDFADGGFFDADTVLVQLEDADYRFAALRAEAQVADAAQLVAQEKGRARQAAREWRDLGNNEANELFLRKPQLAAAQSSLAAAKAELEQARLNLKRTAVSVPFNGRIREKLVDVGQYVSPGTLLAKVYDTDVVQVRVPLTDRQVALLDLPLNFQRSSSGKGAVVSLRARFADREWNWFGEVVRTDASIDIDSRVVYAVVEVPDPFEPDAATGRPPLAIGLFVEAEIQGRTLDTVTTLPRSALRNDGTVLLVNNESRLANRAVRVLKTEPRQVWVQGLQSGENVVIQQPAVAVDGMAVTIRIPDDLAQRGE